MGMAYASWMVSDHQPVHVLSYSKQNYHHYGLRFIMCIHPFCSSSERECHNKEQLHQIWECVTDLRMHDQTKNSPNVVCQPNNPVELWMS